MRLLRRLRRPVLILRATGPLANSLHYHHLLLVILFGRHL
jgi:hypothetical protein